MRYIRYMQSHRKYDAKRDPSPRPHRAFDETVETAPDPLCWQSTPVEVLDAVGGSGGTERRAPRAAACPPPRQQRQRFQSDRVDAAAAAARTHGAPWLHLSRRLLAHGALCYMTVT